MNTQPLAFTMTMRMLRLFPDRRRTFARVWANLQNRSFEPSVKLAGGFCFSG